MYYRYNFIIDGSGSVRGRFYKVTVHSLFFSFKKDSELENIAQDEAYKMYDKIVPDWFVRRIGKGYEEVQPYEAEDIGFYYLHVLLNDKVVKKVHLRHRRRGQSFFTTAVHALYGLVKRLL